MLKVILSPAKSIAKEPILYGQPTTPIHETKAAELIRLLKNKSPQELQELMSISPNLADLNWSRYQEWNTLKSNVNPLQPATAFTGEVYKGLAADNFTDEDWVFAQKSITILSGLYGLLKPLDGIAAYRLEMGTKIQINASTKNLYEYWRKELTQAMMSDLKDDDIIINLASVEYSKAINFKALLNVTINPIFKDIKNGKLKTIMMYAKRARGSMAHFIVKNKIGEVADLKQANIDGYNYDAGLSTVSDWVFTR